MAIIKRVNDEDDHFGIVCIFEAFQCQPLFGSRISQERFTHTHTQWNGCNIGFFFLFHNSEGEEGS